MDGFGMTFTNYMMEGKMRRFVKESPP